MSESKFGLEYSRDIRERMRSVYGDVCRSCDQVMRFGKGGKGCHATLDHIVPRSLGGSDEEDNLQLLCNECNVKKGNKIEPRVDGGPLPLPPSLIPLEPIPVTRDIISRFWKLRCGLCGRLEPCLEHEMDTTHHSG